jgi:hypothetical protein
MVSLSNDYDVTVVLLFLLRHLLRKAPLVLGILYVRLCAVHTLVIPVVVIVMIVMVMVMVMMVMVMVMVVLVMVVMMVVVLVMM